MVFQPPSFRRNVLRARNKPQPSIELLCLVPREVAAARSFGMSGTGGLVRKAQPLTSLACVAEIQRRLAFRLQTLPSRQRHLSAAMSSHILTACASHDLHCLLSPSRSTPPMRASGKHASLRHGAQMFILVADQLQLLTGLVEQEKTRQRTWSHRCEWPRGACSSAMLGDIGPNAESRVSVNDETYSKKIKKNREPWVLGPITEREGLVTEISKESGVLALSA